MRLSKNWLKGSSCGQDLDIHLVASAGHEDWLLLSLPSKIHLQSELYESAVIHLILSIPDSPMSHGNRVRLGAA